MTRRAAKISNTATCPRCGEGSVRSNDIGAWCDNYPCRWSIKRTTAAASSRILEQIWAG